MLECKSKNAFVVSRFTNKKTILQSTQWFLLKFDAFLLGSHFTMDSLKVNAKSASFIKNSCLLLLNCNRAGTIGTVLGIPPVVTN